jgi:hypothetical protein
VDSRQRIDERQEPGGEAHAKVFRGKRVLLVVLVLVSASFLIGRVWPGVFWHVGTIMRTYGYSPGALLVQSNYVEDMENKKLLKAQSRGC